MFLDPLGHDFSEEWEYTNLEHYHPCTRCDAQSDKDEHIYNTSGVCVVCEYNAVIPDIPQPDDPDDPGDEPDVDVPDEDEDEEELIPHPHELTFIPYQEPTCTQGGNIACWYCEVCDA